MVGLSVGFWNIAGVRDKLENDNVRTWFFKHDVVFLSETKTRGTPSMPGFVPINNSKSNHGGIVAFIKVWLYPKISKIDIEHEGVVALELSCALGIRLVGIYNEPTDSLYFRPTTLASISSHVSSGKRCIIVGDLNARLGKHVHDIVKDNSDLGYRVIDETTNENGRTVIRICQSNQLLPVNNLCTPQNSWPSQLTYRKRSNWISEVDLCLVSHSLTQHVQSFAVDQNLSMPSDHAPITVSFDFAGLDQDESELLERSAALGTYLCEDTSSRKRCKKPIAYRRIDKESFTSKMQEIVPPEVRIDNIQESLATFDELVYDTSKESQKAEERRYSSQDKPNTRWKRILDADDTKSLWQGINWKGEFREVAIKERPSELVFQEHMERLLNPDGTEPLQYPDQSQVSIPSLDHPFTLNELDHVVSKQIKPDRSCGPSGTAPGTLKLLPIPWLIFLLSLLNTIFLTGAYPVKWTISKLLMLFKKGLPMDCGNYRGISIIDSLAKCYDYLLNNRLTLWYKPCREQAGAQDGRGCVEHIVTLRLVMDYCIRKKQPLFIAFIDFSKAYDRVPRSYLLNLLKSLGCGVVMLTALTSLFWVTQFILGSTVITAIIGVKQGSPTSCFLFILFVDEFIKLVKGRSGVDGFLQWLHLLMLMDDTVIFATSRQGLIDKLNLLAQWCDKCGMVINEDKTTDPNARKPIDLQLHHGHVQVTHCSEYKYLGAIVTSDGKVSSSLAKHSVAKEKDLNKLMIFLEANKNAPYVVKKTVVDACFNASLLYGCEAWLGVRPSATLKAMHMKAIKMLLGVRQSTPNDACLVEAGYPSLEATVRQRQQKFFKQMKEKRRDMTDDPLMFALELTQQNNPVMNRYIDSVMEEGGDIVKNDMLKRKENLLSAVNTKATTYCNINPDLSVHSVYCTDGIVEDDFRIAFTRLRLSSHRFFASVTHRNWAMGANTKREACVSMWRSSAIRKTCAL